MSEVQSFSHHTEEAIHQITLCEFWNDTFKVGQKVVGEHGPVARTIGPAFLQDGKAWLPLDSRCVAELDHWRPAGDGEYMTGVEQAIVDISEALTGEKTARTTEE